MTSTTFSVAVLLGFVSISAIKISSEEPDAEKYNYGQFGKAMPAFWDDFVARDPFFSNTWRFTGMAGHVISMVNDTAYEGDSPTDYYFPTGTEQWEPDALVFLGESIGEALNHHHEKTSLI